MVDNISEAVVICLIGAFAGLVSTGFLKLLEKYLGRAKEKADADSGIRSELRLELDRKIAENLQLKKELREQEKEADYWRVVYWRLYEIFVNFKLIALSVNGLTQEIREKLQRIVPPRLPEDK